MIPKQLTRVAWWLPCVVLILLLGAALRLVNVHAPPLDFHPTRQLRNALVARAFYYRGLAGADPARVELAQSFRRAVGQYEPPILESLTAATYRIIGAESFAVARVYGTLFWLLAGIALFDLARRATSPGAALVSLMYYMVLPFAVQASRSFQPDPLMTAAFVLGIYCLYRWSEDRQWTWALLGAGFASLAVLVKIVIVFLVAGGAIALVLTSLGRRFSRSPQVWTMAAIMTAPAAVYYLFLNPARSGEYFFAWTVDLIRLITSPHFYADWLGFVGSLVSLTILVLAVVGTIIAAPRLRALLFGTWVGYALYGLMLPFQMYTHSYYHLQLIPVITLGLAPVVEALLERVRLQRREWQAASLAPLLVLTAFQAWAARSVLVAENYDVVPAFWQTVGEAIPADAHVIALTQDYGFDLMYWGWRRAQLWPLNTALSELRAGDRDLAARFDELTAGNDYFLVTAFGQLEDQPLLAAALDEFAVAAQGEGFILYDLKIRR